MTSRSLSFVYFCACQSELLFLPEAGVISELNALRFQFALYAVAVLILSA